MLYIIRGIPGSGKSAFTQRLLADGIVSDIVEAGQFMTDAQGNYKFDPNILTKCHQECQMWTKYYLDEGRNVAVANTFSRRWEIVPYTKMGYQYTIVEMTGNCQNVHNVPKKVIDTMKHRWEKWV